MAQNPITGNQGFQILSEGNFTFTGYTHVHGPLGVGGNLTLNDNGTLAEICMDGVGSYVFPGDGSTTTGLLVKGGITWTAGGAKVMGGKMMHIGSSTGCTQSDNGVNQATQVLPTGGVYNQAKRLEGALDQTPSPAVFQTVGFDFTGLFTTYRANSEGLAACSNNVQLYNASNVAISGNTVSSAQNVQINTLANGVNHLDLTQTSLNNITELKFNSGALPSATKLLVINVPLTSNFVWNNSNMTALSGSSNGAYIVWNFSGTTSYNLTINTASLIIGTVFAPNHNLIKSGTGDIDGNLIAKTIVLGLGEVHYYPFNGSVPLCSTCSNLTSAGTIGAPQTGCAVGFDPSTLTETAAPAGGTGTIEYQWQSSTDNANWTDISGATVQTYDPPVISATTYFRRGVRRAGCTTYIYSASVTMTAATAISITTQPISATIASGGTQTLTVIATGGTPSLTYQWQSSTDNNTFTNISGATSASYTTPALTASTYYKVIVSASGNGCGSVTSATASVAISGPSNLTCTNFLGNPEFNYGTNRWSLTTSSGNTATWSVNTASQLSGTNSALVNITAATGGSANAKKIQFYQTGYVVYSGTTYTVSFQAKAVSNRNITVSLQQVASPYATYATQTVAITTTKNTYTLTFPVTTTDLNGAGLYFNLGETTANVYLDNIVWSEQCGSQLCTNGTGNNIITNSEMDNGLSNWGLSVQGGASATSTIINTSQLSGTNSAFINIGTATGTNWHVQLYQPGHTVQAGTTYRITFKAKATANRNMYVSLQQNYSPWSEIDGKTVSLTTSSQSFTIDFTANQTDENDIGLYFHLGESNADVYIDDVEWAELCNTEICNNGYDDDGDGLIDGADPDCSSCDAPTYGFQNGTLVSGTALSPGAVYLFQNVTPGTDVRVKINSFSHPDVQVSNIDLSSYDAPGGYNLAFQPQVLFGWNNGNGTFDAPGERFVNFTFSFYDAGTLNPQESNKLVLSAIDVDGDNTSLMEFIESSGFSSYETNSPTALTLSGALKAKSNISNATNIDETALDHMISYTYQNKTSINVKYGADWNGASTTFADNRLNSMYFKCYSLNTQVACPTVTISGTYSSVCTGVSQQLTSNTSGGTGSKTYQWQMSLDNQTWTDIAGATSNKYTTPALTAKTYYRLGVSFGNQASCGMVYSDDFPITPGACVENCSNGVDDNGNGLVDGADLDCVTLCATGSLNYQRWLNINGSSVSDLTGNANYPNNPTESGLLTSFDGPDNIADNYGTRVRGYITPSVTGNYVFNLTSDDGSQLFLSPNADPANKANIASVNGWTNPAEYNKYSSQTSSPYYLLAGRNYYIELLQKEGGGLDHFQVYWKTPSNSNWTIVPGGNLRPYNCTEICGNGQDDDGDGLADCADSDCKLGLAVNAGAGASICSGASASLNAVGSGGTTPYTYAWSNSLGNGASKSVSPTSTTTYIVTITSANGCTATGQVTVTVNAMPTASAGASTSICAGTSTTLTGTGGGTYAWSTGASTAAISVSPVTTTTYTVTVTSAGGCTATAQTTVTVNAIPTASAGANATICAGANATLTATGGTTYSWSNGIGTGAAKIVSPATTTTYTVTVTNASGCTATSQVTVTVNTAPTANAGADATICGGLSTTLTATGGTTYAWSNSLGSGATKTVNPITTTTYTVTVTNAQGCTATDQVVVNINAAPVASAGSNVAICNGTSTTLTGSASGGVSPYTYAWDNALGSGASKNVSPIVTTTYTVTVTGSNSCTSTAQATVTLNAKPTASAGADITICPLTSTTLTATGSGAPSPYSYTWSNGFSGASQTVLPLLTTTYTVTVTSSNGCFATATKKVTVGACTEICNNLLDDDGDGLADCADSDCGPSANAGADISICPGTPAFLSVGVTGGSAPYTYAWSNGLGTGASKTVSPLVTTTYSVTVTSASGCTNVDQIKVTVNACSENCTNGIDDDGDGLVDCADPDCSGVTAPVLADDNYTTCPGLTYSNRVTYNDGNLNNPAFTIAVQPLHGTVNIDWTGMFVYTPNTFECLTDYFTYQVCNQSSGCCETAVVSITLGDNTLPVLTNVPADLTISCDDAIPSPSVVTAFDQCPGIYMDYEESSSQSYVGACGSYTLTRTWTATDFCGNAATSNQVITVLDQTKPEIFQLYTLEGGAKMVAGYTQRVTHDWKYVRFPITFKATPVVLASLSTNTDVTAVVTQVRNVSMQGFELRLREEEAFDGKHGTENVSWVAVDADYQSGNLKWEAGTLANVSEVPTQLNFQQAYTTAPMFFASPMTNGQSDPASLRNIGLSGTGVQLFAQEEQSADAEVVRASETAGYLALKAGSLLVDKDGNMFGEAGKLDVTNAWATISFARKYTKPVVIVGGLTNNDTQPVMLRVRNITSSKFEVRLQEWGYEDGAHSSESISWMVVEGGVPGNQSFYCSGKASDLKPNINIFAVDNCDDLVSFSYNESSVQAGAGLIQNHSWTAMDDCGNTTLISRFDTCQVAAVKVKGLLYGSLAGNSNMSLMRDNLREKHLLPKDEPYTQLPNYPYVEYVGHGASGNGNGNDDDDDHDPMVVICHLTGTPQQQTMSVHQSELGYYLSIGDVVGACSNSNSGNTIICHKPGTPAQKTLSVPQSALLAHLAHGDLIGDCTGSGNEVSTGAANAEYQTIADGNWTATATWLGGQVPPTGNINGKTISIKHNVTIPNAGIVIRNGSKLWVTSGSLKFVNQDFEVRDGEAYFDRAVLDMSTAGNIKITNAAAKLQFSDCSVNIGQSILNQSGGKIKMSHVELKVSENYINTGGTDTLSNVCAVIQGNLTNNLLSKIYISNANIRLPNGSLTNLGTISGGGIKLLIENGSLINTLATWTAPLTQYCVSGTIPLLSGLLPAIEDCNNISNLFSPCNCYDADGATSGSGSGTTGVVSNVTSQINPGKSYGDGTIDDLAALDVTGSEAIVDWMLVEIRNPQNEAEVLGYQSVMLKRDGQLIGENGDSVLVFPGLEEGDYYVSIRHRNHLGVMTLDPVFLSMFDPALVDFSDPNMLVKGGNKGGKANAGKRTLWGGDFNGDGKIIYQGPHNDVFNLFTRVVGDGNNTANLANFIVPGYELQDFNMDGKVIYQGPLNDRGAMLFGSILSHPGNMATLANYIAMDFIP